MRKIGLTNYASKILCITMLLITLAFTVLITFFSDTFNIYATLFMISITIFCGLGTFLSFNHKIIITNNQMVLKNLISQTIKISEIKNIHNNIVGNFIVFETEKSRIILSGYTMLLNKNKQLKKTEEIIEILKNMLLKN